MNPCVHCGAPFVPVVAGQASCDRCQGLAQPEPRSIQQAEVAGFKVLHELGAGRFAHSWLGEDARSHAVVVKVLRRYAPDPEAVQRFLAEAQRLAAVAELDHPCVARPLSAGIHLVQAFFLVYESGGELTLADELRQRGRVAAARAFELCAQVCEGLSAGHRAGVLHLDLKPANVGLVRLLDGSEQAVVLDCVTAHLMAHVGLRDEEPLPLSTAAYTAPEVAAGDPGTERSDLYSAGVLLFQLLTGRLPVTGATAGELLRAHREQAALRLCDIGRRVHPELEDLLARLMAKDPAERPESGDEAAVMMRSLAALAEAVPVEDTPEEDDPLPVITPRPEAPPEMLPAVDPELERAMLGEVPEPPPEEPPGIPAWATFVAPRWWPVAAAALLTVTIGTALLARGRPHLPPPAVVQSTLVAVAPAPASVVEPARREDPPAAAADPAEPEPPRPNKLAQTAASPWAKNFERAQKALWTNRPGGAQTILNDILRKPGLTRRDRARASKMMGDALAKRGNRAAAAQWWRKSFQLYDDPEDRAKVARLIAAGR
ncbi:MAG: protein kinase domain-containing protein [Myxococcales bacterium]